jgi:hypothetical protein
MAAVEMGLELPKSSANERNGPLAEDMQEASDVRWLDTALLAYGRSFDHPAKIRLVRWLIRRLAAGRVRICYAAPG